MTLIERITTLIEPILADLNLGLVRVQLSGGQRPTLQIMIERLDDQPVSMNDCVSVSRQVSVLLDVEDPIQSAYRLEVTSPGEDRPLTKPGDYARFKGAKIQLEAHETIDGRRRFKGTLQDVREDGIVLRLEEDVEQVDLEIRFETISRAKLVPLDREVPIKKGKQK